MVSIESPEPAVQKEIESSALAHLDSPYFDYCWHSENGCPGADCSANKEPGRNLEGKLLRCFGEQQAFPEKDAVEPIEGMAVHLPWEFHQKTNGAHWMEC